MEPPLFLLVDDDPDDIMLLKEAIHSLDKNIEFAEAKDGRAALTFLKEAKLNGRLPGLIVLDINMPILNGREAMALIKKEDQLKQIPLVIFSTSSYPTDIIYCREHGVELIVKPFEMKVLMEVAKKLVKTYATHRANSM
ncbi:MAG: response regulator [Ferruginibacter sp.]